MKYTAPQLRKKLNEFLDDPKVKKVISSFTVVNGTKEIEISPNYKTKTPEIMCYYNKKTEIFEVSGYGGSFGRDINVYKETKMLKRAVESMVKKHKQKVIRIEY